MQSSERLNTLAEIARSLLREAELSERIGQALAALRATLLFTHARVIVLDSTPWSYVVPPQAVPSSALPWPQRWTAELIQARQPRTRHVGDACSYHAWPVLWETELLGALELLSPREVLQPAENQLVSAILPLFAAAFANRPGTLSAQAAPKPNPIVVETLREQLEPPLLLQPLSRLILEWVGHHIPVTQASLHLQHQVGSEVRMISFALGGRRGISTMSSSGTQLQPLHATFQSLARRALDEQRPLWRRNGYGLAFGLPLISDGAAQGVLVVVGPELEQGHIQLLNGIAPMVGAALRRAEFYHHLVEARTHLQHVFDSLPTGLALLDGEGRLLRANPAWTSLWGLPPGTVRPMQMVPWDMFEPLLARIPDPIIFDTFFRRWDAEPREETFVLQHPHQELHMLLIPVHDSLRLRPSYLLAVDDVTRERELDRLKSEFVSVVSHELRTPLTSILGYTELLQAREFPTPERRELIETVWKQATHLSNLVENLLNVSRIDANRITLTRWVLSLSQLVNELTAQLNKALDQSRHRLLLDVSDRLPPVYADRDRLRQVLGNLLSNAIKYSPEGGEIVLHADVLRTPPPGAPPLPPEPALLISVRDPGIGIAADELPRIFERFYRVDNSNTRKIGGTGLGLAISQALVELHGGRIWVDSTPGAGSTFFFTLPLADPESRSQH